MPQTTPLTQAQQEALSLIAAGSTIASAADQLAIHRNTIGNWLRSSNFRQALEFACLDQSIFWRDHAHQMAADALAAIQAILTDPKTPAAVRLRAALPILDKASAPLPRIPADLQPQNAPPENPQEMHNSAQRPNEINQMPPSQMPIPGRNQPCICGSGRKFKHCCIGRSKSELFLIRLHNMPDLADAESDADPAVASPGHTQ